MDILDRIDAAVGCQQCGGELGDSPSDDFCSEACQRRWRTEHHAEVLVGYREPWQRPEDFPGVGTEAHDTSGERGGFGLGYSSSWVIAAVDESYGWARADRARAQHHSNGIWCPNPSLEVSVEGWGYPERARVPAETYVECAGDGCRILILVSVNASADGVVCPRCDLLRRQEDWRLPRQTGDLMTDIRECNRAREAATTDAQRAAVRLRTEQLVERSRESFRRVQVAFTGIAQAVGQAAQRIGRELCRAMGLSELPESTGDEQRDRMAAALHAQRNRNTGPQQRPSGPRTIGRPTSAARR